MFGIILATLVFVGYVLLLLWLASWKNPRFVVIAPENTTAIVIKKPNTLSLAPDGTVAGVNNDGGGVTNVIHGIGGKMLNKSDSDPQNWKMVKGKEKRGLFFHLFDIQFIWFFRYLRINDVRTFRWGRKDNQDTYRMMAKSDLTRFAFFTGQHDILQEHVETKAVIKFNLRLNITWEETYPVRARLKQADAYAQMTIMVNDHVVNKIGAVDPKEFIAGGTASDKAKETLKKDLTRSIIDEARQPIEDVTGITIITVSLPDFDFDAETRVLLEAATKATLTSEAGIITAENEAKQAVARAKGDRDARILRNEGDAHRVENVIKPLAQDERTVQVAGYDAYRDNETMTTLVVGSGATPVVPVGGRKEWIEWAGRLVVRPLTFKYIM
jgi:hypothetical protein